MFLAYVESNFTHVPEVDAKVDSREYLCNYISIMQK